MAGGRVAHRFGGVWTEIKLRALTEYAELEEGGILEGTPIEHVERILDGMLARR